MELGEKSAGAVLASETFLNCRERKIMVNIEDMTPVEMKSLLIAKDFGHLGCARSGRPYVVPMHYAYDGECIYFLTTEGAKTDYIESNNEVCFQVEEIIDRENWQSVMVTGRAERITEPEEKEHAMQKICSRNPTATPAISVTAVDAWTRQTTVAFYRIHTEMMDGRKTIGKI